MWLQNYTLIVRVWFLIVAEMLSTSLLPSMHRMKEEGRLAGSTLKGQGHEIRMAWNLNGMLSDISLHFLNFPVNILSIFKFLKGQGHEIWFG